MSFWPFSALQVHRRLHHIVNQFGHWPIIYILYDCKLWAGGIHDNYDTSTGKFSIISYTFYTLITQKTNKFHFSHVSGHRNIVIMHRLQALHFGGWNIRDNYRIFGAIFTGLLQPTDENAATQDRSQQIIAQLNKKWFDRLRHLTVISLPLTSHHQFDSMLKPKRISFQLYIPASMLMR